uniref:Uncharacterized protein n=1 Tax=Cacopsylla melanoneura TaxID=428564 RepID=A0A8D8M5F4_9HEMI
MKYSTDPLVRYRLILQTSRHKNTSQKSPSKKHYLAHQTSSVKHNSMKFHRQPYHHLPSNNLHLRPLLKPTPQHLKQIVHNLIFKENQHLKLYHHLKLIMSDSQILLRLNHSSKV